MLIGIPRERLQDEYRVGLGPEQAAELARLGHRIRVEAGAGAAAGFADAAYAAAGAVLCDAADAWAAELVVKVKCPLRDEVARLRPGQVLFAYLHFDGNAPRADIAAIVATGATAVAYEWVEEGGRLPLLEPMSRLSGVLFARRALELLLASRRHLGGDYGLGAPAARALVIGAGHIGAHALATLARNGVALTVVDKRPATLDARLAAAWDGWRARPAPRVIPFDEARPDASVAAICAELPRTDILIGAAVRRPSLPRERCRYLVDRTAVAAMTPGSVLCDATAEIRNLFETAVPTGGLLETYTECGVVHYNCDHIPSLAAHTATRLLTAATFPSVRLLAGGFAAAAAAAPALAAGTMCRGGRLTHALTAHNKGLDWTPLAAAG